MDRMAQLPWAPAEAIARLQCYATTQLTYGALAYATHNALTRLDALQLRIDHVARKQAGRSVCKEVLYDANQNGGVGVPQVRKKLMATRVSSLLRMWNADGSICSDLIKWDAERATEMKNKKAKPEDNIYATDREYYPVGMGVDVPPGVTRYDLSTEVKDHMSDMDLVICIAKPTREGPWRPTPAEFHPQTNALAARIKAEAKDGAKIVMGADGGVLKDIGKRANITAGMAVVIYNDKQKIKLQAGIRIKGTPTSFYAEAVALEQTAYLAVRAAEAANIKEIKIVSDSLSNVRTVKDCMDGREIPKSNATPTRTNRIAELVRQSKGTLEWVRGHQAEDGTDEIEVNNRADKQATDARKDGAWDPLQKENVAMLK
eukprot:gene49437-40555_t